MVELDDIVEAQIVIRQICRCLPKLKQLAVKECSKINEAVLRNLILSCKELERLDFSGTTFKGNRFYEEIAGLTNLKYILFITLLYQS